MDDVQCIMIILLYMHTFTWGANERYDNIMDMRGFSGNEFKVNLAFQTA